MSAILTNRIKNHIDASLKGIMYLEDCPNDEPKCYSRGLVGICLSGLSSQPYSAIVDYIVDGAGDNGIDGTFYDSVRNKLYVIQAKWSSKGTGTIDTGDIRKFIAGVGDLLNEDWKKFNKRIKAVSGTIAAGIKKDPEIVLVAAYNSENALSSECQSIIDKFLKDNNSEFQDVVSFKVFDLKHLVRTMKTAKSGAKADVDINLLQWGEQKDPYYAIYGKVSCADLAEWYKIHDELLFSENIRSALSNSDINSQIEDTLLRTPADFWYLNNGVTAIADSIARKPVGLLTVA